MVETKHSAEALGALDGARRRFAVGTRLDQPIIDPLMIPLPVIVSGVLSEHLIVERHAIAARQKDQHQRQDDVEQDERDQV
jgi:hypothetical protein